MSELKHRKGEHEKCGEEKTLNINIATTDNDLNMSLTISLIALQLIITLCGLHLQHKSKQFFVWCRNIETSMHCKAFEVRENLFHVGFHLDTNFC